MDAAGEGVFPVISRNSPRREELVRRADARWPGQLAGRPGVWCFQDAAAGGVALLRQLEHKELSFWSIHSTACEGAIAQR